MNMYFRSPLLALLLLTGCGYRLGDQGVLCQYSTLSVPFVCGDNRGWLTNEIILKLSRTGAVRVTPSGGQLTLCASIVDSGRENIGFQYDQNRDDVRTDRIIANEGRLFIVVEVSLLERSGCTVVGPIRFSSHVDYDFNPLATDTELSTFSLGQFTEIDQAEEVALRPLYEDLAQKIVDYLRSYW